MVSIGEDDVSLRKNLKKYKCHKDLELIDYDGGAGKYVMFYYAQTALIRIPQLPRKTNEYAALAHEIGHVVISVMRVIGMRIEPGGGSDEAYTYLISYITKEIFEEIKKYY